MSVDLLLPAWTLGVHISGVILGYVVTRAAQNNSGDDGPGAVGPDELDRGEQ